MLGEILKLLDEIRDHANCLCERDLPPVALGHAEIIKEAAARIIVKLQENALQKF